eukprot:Skav209961  [mRNA]  locus=scaffold2867:46387:50853:+ [translate_table: standard]
MDFNQKTFPNSCGADCVENKSIKLQVWSSRTVEASEINGSRSKCHRVCKSLIDQRFVLPSTSLHVQGTSQGRRGWITQLNKMWMYYDNILLLVPLMPAGFVWFMNRVPK